MNKAELLQLLKHQLSGAPIRDQHLYSEMETGDRCRWGAGAGSGARQACMPVGARHLRAAGPAPVSGTAGRCWAGARLGADAHAGCANLPGLHTVTEPRVRAVFRHVIQSKSNK